MGVDDIVVAGNVVIFGSWHVYVLFYVSSVFLLSGGLLVLSFSTFSPCNLVVMKDSLDRKLCCDYQHVNLEPIDV